MKFERSMKWLVILLLFIILFYALGPKIYSNSGFFESLIIFSILTLAFNVIYGFTGYLPFGYAAFFGIGAYGFGIGIINNMGAPISFLFGGLLSVLLALIFSPMLKLRGAYFSIANLAAFEGVYYIISNESLTNITHGPYGISVASVYNLNLVYLLSIIVLLILILITFYIKNSNFGLALKAIKENQLTASLAGINVGFYRTVAWLISAVFAGFSGSLYGWFLGFFYPESVFSINYSVFVIVFTIFGGAGTLFGPLIGAMSLYSIYDAVGIAYPEYFTLMFGIILVLLILFLPDGLKKIFKQYLKREMI